MGEVTDNQQRIMGHFFIPGLIIALTAILGCLGLSWQLLRQNGRIVLRLEELEKRLEEFDEPQAGSSVSTSGEQDRANRFSNRSLARSKIKRDGLKAGAQAPDFQLPRLDGSGELALSELRGRRVLIAFSSPSCGPCNALAPKLEKFHRKRPDVEVIMIGKGDPAENLAKVNEHGLSFPVVLQQGWEISRRYAIFATPVAYLIDQNGILAHDVAVGVDNIQDLLAGIPRAKEQMVP